MSAVVHDLRVAVSVEYSACFHVWWAVTSQRMYDVLAVITAEVPASHSARSMPTSVRMTVSLDMGSDASAWAGWNTDTGQKGQILDKKTALKKPQWKERELRKISLTNTSHVNPWWHTAPAAGRLWRCSTSLQRKWISYWQRKTRRWEWSIRLRNNTH